MYKHILRVHGEYLAKAQSLPANASIDGNGGSQRAGGTMAAMEAVAVVNEAVGLATTEELQIKLTHSDTADSGFVELGTVAAIVAAGAYTAAAGQELGRFALPSNTKRYVRATLSTTDAAASGKVDVFFSYLPR